MIKELNPASDAGKSFYLVLFGRHPEAVGRRRHRTAPSATSSSLRLEPSWRNFGSFSLQPTAFRQFSPQLGVSYRWAENRLCRTRRQTHPSRACCGCGQGAPASEGVPNLYSEASWTATRRIFPHYVSSALQ